MFRKKGLASSCIIGKGAEGLPPVHFKSAPAVHANTVTLSPSNPHEPLLRTIFG